MDREHSLILEICKSLWPVVPITRGFPSLTHSDKTLDVAEAIEKSITTSKVDLISNNAVVVSIAVSLLDILESQPATTSASLIFKDSFLDFDIVSLSGKNDNNSDNEIDNIDKFYSIIDTELEVEFEKTDAFKWLTKHAAKFHFKLSFDRKNKYIDYEPWHWRYEGSIEALKVFETSNKKL